MDSVLRKMKLKTAKFPINLKSRNDRLKFSAVANVRLAFVRSLSKTRGGCAFRGSCDPSIIHHSLEILLSDKDVDCRRAARISLGIPDTENAVNVSLFYISTFQYYDLRFRIL